MFFIFATYLEYKVAFGDCLLEQEVLEQEIYTFQYNGQEHNLLIVGIGPVNAGIGMGLVIAYLQNAKACKSFTDTNYRLPLVVNLGVAGSFDIKQAELGSAFIIDEEIYPEYGLASAFDVDAKALGFSQYVDSKQDICIYDSVKMPSVLKLAELGYNISLDLNTATSLSVAGVTYGLERAERLHKKYARDQVLLENMEGFSVAVSCLRHNIPCLEIRTVSNLVGSRKAEERDFPKALQALQIIVRNLLGFVPESLN